MNNSLAKTLSYILHPVVYPILGLLILLEFSPLHTSSKALILSLVFVFIGTYVFPIIISFLFYRLNIIENLEMRLAKDRKWPYLIGAISYYFTASFLQKLNLPDAAFLYLIGSTLIIVLHLVLLQFSKPSAHLAGIGGFTGLLLAISFQFQLGLLPYIVICILLAGFLASARLQLKAHTFGELITGYFSGLLLIFFTLLLG